jgi:hypothetical protein
MRWHQRIDYVQLRAVLKENQLTRTEIARQFGCSKERVRQLELKLLGRTGLQARLEREERRISEETSKRLRSFRQLKFIREAVRRGLAVEPLHNQDGSLKMSVCVVNRKRVILRKTGQGKRSSRTIRIRLPRTNNDVCVFETPLGLLIFPEEKLPKSNTEIAIRPDPRYGAKTHRHDYLDYLNRWDVFQPRKRKHIKE